MWILDTSADCFQGRRTWLKPGQRYLFGRVKKDGVMIAIDDKTVSRQHFSICVDHVQENDVGNIFARTKIRVEDHSKSGTTVNGECLRKKDPKDDSEPNPSRELIRPENSIRPGKCADEFTVIWQPCVFTFNLMKKELKTGVLKQKQANVRSYDIKAISDFSSEHTTHVVASKRNTPKGLQALVNGKHLVTEAYLDALDYATTPGTLSQDVNLSPLENDFDGSWPDTIKYLPPPGKEPTIKPAEAYQPNPARSTVFEKYTFVFCDQNQYDNLMPVITDGHGKALLFKVVNGETTSDQMLEFVKNAAGQKNGSMGNGISIGGVVLVRSSFKDEGLQSWTTAILNQTVLRMDQRAIDQSEFLEAILSNDAGLLKQAVPFEDTNDRIIAPPPSAANSIVSQLTQSRMNEISTSQTPENGEACRRDASLAHAPAPARHPSQMSAPNGSQSSRPSQVAPSKPSFAPKTTQPTKFENFDDGFDADSIAEYDDEEVIDDEECASEPLAQPKPHAQMTDFKQEPPSTSKKRPRSPDTASADVFADEMDDLLPAATALKRRKLAEAAANGHLNQEEPQTRKAHSKANKTEKVLDVRAAVRKRQEEAEAARKVEEDQGPPDVGNTAPANLVQVVAVELPLRDKKLNNKENGGHGPGWDPKWNGRKNFKRFRGKGDAPQRSNRAGKVIVPLEEVPNKTGGLGEKYYTRTEEEREIDKQKKRKELARNQRTTQGETQQMSSNGSRRSKTRVVLDDDEEDLDDFGFGDVGGSSRSVRHPSPVISRLQREAAAIVEHDIDPDSPRQTRAADRSQHEAVDGSDTELGDATQRKTQLQKGKRPATSSIDTSKSKRQKTLTVKAVRDEESDDDDDTKFRFGSRARRGRGRGGKA